ncbi:terminase gpP N-terminus-related DNA-binding protein [Ligilactobacillus acidipiscis]|uniref:terminase gpP N-terminus-related DNA-binding protein n=1 Tax=Ligilactobacillus acidipiscis TaxID=89059 RepID=UPI0022DF2D01|nr:MerR family transcriptional regulator [Ligilactobacillus acidipiscis]
MTNTYRQACLELARYFDQHPDALESDPEVIRLRKIVDDMPFDNHVKHHHKQVYHDLDRQVSELYWQGYTLGEIARKIKCTTETVRVYMKKYDLDPKRNQKQNVSVQKIRRMLTKGMTIQQMATDSASPKVIHKIILENGMMTRYQELQAMRHQYMMKTESGWIRYESRAELTTNEHMGYRKFVKLKENGTIMSRFDYLKKARVKV